MAENAPALNPDQLRLKRLGIDTYKQPVIYMHRQCYICRSEGFAAQARVKVELNGRDIVATLNVVDSDLLTSEQGGLSNCAWQALAGDDGDVLTISHAADLDSLRGVRAKLFGETLVQADWNAIINDIAAGRYADIHLAAFVAACAAGRMSLQETIGLTRAMLEAGSHLQWPRSPIADKHCIGGLPGNRTSLIIVPIITAAGLTMPKTSSRAITSPAGTADTMEVLAPVTHDLASMRRIVEREGGCIVWGGSVALSPADDTLISVERPLDIDSALGLAVQIVFTDGLQPVGRGIGPALEARDVLQVLRRDHAAPLDLRERSLLLAGSLLEFCGSVAEGNGHTRAAELLDSGQAFKKFLTICDAQGGFKEPPRAAFMHVIESDVAGRIIEVGNRRLARIAKLAGAPRAPAAGIDLHVMCWSRVEKGMPLFTVHAETPGELQYALASLVAGPEVFRLERE